MSYIILSPTKFLFLDGNNNHEIISPMCLGDIDPLTVKSIIWDARDSTSIRDSIKEYIETFVLLEKLCVVDVHHDLREWVENTCYGKFYLASEAFDVLLLPDFIPSTIHERENKEIIISNVCWSPCNEEEAWGFLKSKGITKLNIALSMYGDNGYDVTFVKGLRKRLDMVGMTVVSVNSVFYGTNENIFTSYDTYLQRFCQHLDFASILGAKYIIYGSATSKNVCIPKYKTLTTYSQAYTHFAKVMKMLADVAKKYDIKIYIKPNKKNCNFIFDEQHATDIVGAIEHENVLKGTVRCDKLPFTCFDTFTLVEFPTRLTDYKCYLDQTLRSLTCFFSTTVL